MPSHSTLPRGTVSSPLVPYSLLRDWGNKDNLPKGKTLYHQILDLKLPTSKPHLYLRIMKQFISECTYAKYMENSEMLWLCKEVLFMAFFAKLYSFWQFPLLKNKVIFPRTDIGVVTEMLWNCFTSRDDSGKTDIISEQQICTRLQELQESQRSPLLKGNSSSWAEGWHQVSKSLRFSKHNLRRLKWQGNLLLSSCLGVMAALRICTMHLTCCQMGPPHWKEPLLSSFQTEASIKHTAVHWS